MQRSLHFPSGILMLLLVTGLAQAQSVPGVKLLHFSSPYTSFPDTARQHGHLYDQVLYDAATHYQDSSVLLVVPDHLHVSRRLDLVFWFHGWRNNIDSAAVRYGLIRQFAASGCNAVLVLPETARDAPDSYGGKLEQPGMFRRLTADVMVHLRDDQVISRHCRPGNITLAGHSGAYEVIASILQNGDRNIRETDLFDALYARVGRFTHWLLSGSRNRFVNWYTNSGGGTDVVSLEMLKELGEKKVPDILVQEDSLTAEILQSNRIIFVHSSRPHDDIICQPDHFELLLRNNPFLTKIRK